MFYCVDKKRKRKRNRKRAPRKANASDKGLTEGELPLRTRPTGTKFFLYVVL